MKHVEQMADQAQHPLPGDEPRRRNHHNSTVKTRSPPLWRTIFGEIELTRMSVTGTTHSMGARMTRLGNATVAARSPGTVGLDDAERHYEWMLGMRIRNAADALSGTATDMLDSRIPGWNSEPVDDEIDYALVSENTDLNDAFTISWNTRLQPGADLSFTEIRRLAAADGVGSESWAR